MAVVIGIGYTAVGQGVSNDIYTIAARYQYDVLSKTEECRVDASEGIENTKKLMEWTDVLLIGSVSQDGVFVSSDAIDQELTEFEIKSREPKFFEFLSDVAELAERKCSKLDFFFASEWYASDHVRICYGPVRTLISILSLPGHWGGLFLNPQTRRYYGSDETPLLFEVRSQLPIAPPRR